MKPFYFYNVFRIGSLPERERTEKYFAETYKHMKLNTVVYLLLGLVLLPAIYFIAMLLAPPGKVLLSSSGLLLLGSIALPLLLVVFAPILVRRWRGLPEIQMTPSDIRFTIAVVAVACPLVFWACRAGGAFGSLVIMLVPIAFLLRGQQRTHPGPHDTNV